MKYFVEYFISLDMWAIFETMSNSLLIRINKKKHLKQINKTQLILSQLQKEKKYVFY